VRMELQTMLSNSGSHNCNDGTDDATKQVFNLAERMVSVIDDGAKSLDVFCVLPVRSSRQLLAAIKNRYVKKNVNQNTIKTLLQSLNNVYRLEESFRVIHKIATPHTPHNLKASRGSRGGSSISNGSSSFSRQKSASRQSSPTTKLLPTTPNVLAKTPELLHPQEGQNKSINFTKEYALSHQKDAAPQQVSIKVDVKVDMSDWDVQIESMNSKQKRLSPTPPRKSPYVVINQINEESSPSPEVKMNIQSVGEGTPQARYNDVSTMKAIRNFLSAARSLNDFVTVLKQCDKIETSISMRNFTTSFRQALRKPCHRIQTPQNVLNDEKMYIHDLEKHCLKNENEMELLQSVVDKERIKFHDKRDEYDRAIKSWKKVVEENKIEYNKLDADAESWLNTEEKNINVREAEAINVLETKRDQLKQMFEVKKAENKLEVMKVKRRNAILKAEIQNKVDKYDDIMKEAQDKIDVVQNDIYLIHQKIKQYELKWEKQNYEDQKMQEAKEMLRKKRQIAENYWLKREDGAIALQKIYKGWRYRTYGNGNE
jgi:hypothetical protein